MSNLSNAVEAVTQAIREDMKALANEQRYPQFSVDESEERTQHWKGRITVLRVVRETLEVQDTGAML
jgi:hypothetical protein